MGRKLLPGGGGVKGTGPTVLTKTWMSHWMRRGTFALVLITRGCDAFFGFRAIRGTLGDIQPNRI